MSKPITDKEIQDFRESENKRLTRMFKYDRIVYTLLIVLLLCVYNYCMFEVLGFWGIFVYACISLIHLIMNKINR